MCRMAGGQTEHNPGYDCAQPLVLFDSFGPITMATVLGAIGAGCIEPCIGRVERRSVDSGAVPPTPACQVPYSATTTRADTRAKTTHGGCWRPPLFSRTLQLYHATSSQSPCDHVPSASLLSAPPHPPTSVLDCGRDTVLDQRLV